MAAMTELEIAQRVRKQHIKEGQETIDKAIYVMRSAIRELEDHRKRLEDMPEEGKFVAAPSERLSWAANVITNMMQHFRLDMFVTVASRLASVDAKLSMLLNKE